MKIRNITLTDDQETALKRFTQFLTNKSEKYIIIQGAAGTGKSTLIEFLVHALEVQFEMYALLLRTNKKRSDFQVQLTATTNKAAAVLTELTGLSAQTIHAFLGLKVSNNVSTGTVKLTKKKDWNLIFNTLLIIDESSMINDQLLAYIEETCQDCKIVFIGDKYQLAPVRQVVPIMDKLNCPKAELNKVMRHSGPILHTSAIFREVVETLKWKNVPNLPELQQLDGKTFQNEVNNAFLNKESAKILAWTNKKVLAYNAYIRDLLGYPAAIQPGEYMFTNNPIMLGSYHLPTDSGVLITDVGPLTSSHDVPGNMVQINHKVESFMPVSQTAAKQCLNRIAKEAKKNKSKWSLFFELKNTWLDLRPSYSSTVHKAQGATYDTVFMDLADIGRCNIATDVARMMYVGISRAAKQVYFYGDLPPKYKE